jgi:hypothetical protein
VTQSGPLPSRGVQRCQTAPLRELATGNVFNSVVLQQTDKEPSVRLYFENSRPSEAGSRIRPHFAVLLRHPKRENDAREAYPTHPVSRLWLSECSASNQPKHGGDGDASDRRCGRSQLSMRKWSCLSLPRCRRLRVQLLLLIPHTI